MKPKAQQRSWYIIALLMCTAGVALIILGALKENVVFFLTPSEWIEKQKEYSGSKMIRLGGKVEKQSLIKDKDTITFKITDYKHSIHVIYQGVVPDLFREDQGVVAEGNFEANGIFKASRILAKHDENYMPKEVADKLKERNLWQGETVKSSSTKAIVIAKPKGLWRSSCILSRLPRHYVPRNDGHMVPAFMKITRADLSI